MSRRIVCTGLGTVNPLGVGRHVSWSALKQMQSGLVKLRDEHSFQGCQSLVAAYVPTEQINEQISSSKHSYLQKNAKQLSRATMFAMVAAHEALEDAKLLNHDLQIDEKSRDRCGVALGQGMVDFMDIFENGSLISDVNNKNGYRKVSPYFMTRALINMSAGNISIRYKAKGPNHCVSTACATGGHSIGDAMNFIRQRVADVMICGSTEASINRIAMVGFDRLRALSTKYNDNPGAASRPFDQHRCGFVMGEGAGVMILEDMEHAKSRGLDDKDILCEVLGYGTSSDGFHLTAPSSDGSGAKMAMNSAMRDANIQPEAISHVNAHATSTPLGDDIECNAVEDLFYNENSRDTNDHLTMTSCKGAIGHLLGAAGSVETIFAAMSCKDATLPPCQNLEKPLETDKNMIKFVIGGPQDWNRERRVLLKNSFGFGGTNASLVISNYIP